MGEQRWIIIGESLVHRLSITVNNEELMMNNGA